MYTTLEDRLVAVEAENARLRKMFARQAWVMRLTGTLVVVAVGVTTVVGAKFPNVVADGTFDTLTVKKLVVKDANDRDRIKLSTGEHGTVAKIVLLDGAESGGVYMWPESTMFYAQRSGGDTPSAFFYAGKTSSEIVSTSGGGNAPVGLYAVENAGGLYLRNRKTGHSQAHLSVIDETASLAIHDKNGTKKALIKIEGDDKPRVLFQDTGIATLVAKIPEPPTFVIENGVLKQRSKEPEKAKEGN